MQTLFPIDEVARRTGLTSRALRYYESRGLLAPSRSPSGRRVFCAQDLERIHRITALKKAGLKLEAIKTLLAGPAIPLADMLRAQLSAVRLESEHLATTERLLTRALASIDGGDTLDAGMLCELISEETRGDSNSQGWEALARRYLPLADQAQFVAELRDTQRNGETADTTARWRELGARIKAALPLDPASEAAQGFVDEWFALLAPLRERMSPRVWVGTARIFDHLDEWANGDANPGFGREVWEFIKLATSAKFLADKIGEGL